MAPDVVERIGRGAAQVAEVLVEPVGAAVDGLRRLSGRSSSGSSRLGFDERHDDERRDGGAKGVVRAGRRGVDVEALGAFGAAPGAVGPLVGEQELDAAVDGAVICFGLGGVMGAGLGPVVASGEILTLLSLWRRSRLLLRPRRRRWRRAMRRNRGDDERRNKAADPMM